MVGMQYKLARSGKTKRKPLPVIIKKLGKSASGTSLHPAPRYTIDYKNTKVLVQCISPQGKILSRRVSGLTAKQQRIMAKAIKRARMSGLLPFVNLDVGTRIR